MTDLYAQIHSWDNLMLAFKKAARGKRNREPAARFEFRLEDNLIELRDALRKKTYRVGPPGNESPGYKPNPAEAG